MKLIRYWFGANKYEKIGSGDKVRYFYVKQPNRYGIKSFAYKYEFPKEFQSDILPDTEMIIEDYIPLASGRLVLVMVARAVFTIASLVGLVAVGLIMGWV